MPPPPGLAADADMGPEGGQTPQASFHTAGDSPASSPGLTSDGANSRQAPSELPVAARELAKGQAAAALREEYFPQASSELPHRGNSSGRRSSKTHQESKSGHGARSQLQADESASQQGGAESKPRSPYADLEAAARVLTSSKGDEGRSAARVGSTGRPRRSAGSSIGSRDGRDQVKDAADPRAKQQRGKAEGKAPRSREGAFLGLAGVSRGSACEVDMGGCLVQCLLY